MEPEIDPQQRAQVRAAAAVTVADGRGADGYRARSTAGVRGAGVGAGTVRGGTAARPVTSVVEHGTPTEVTR
jgi:hypothetical protein